MTQKTLNGLTFCLFYLLKSQLYSTDYTFYNFKKKFPKRVVILGELIFVNLTRLAQVKLGNSVLHCYLFESVEMSQQ